MMKLSYIPFYFIVLLIISCQPKSGVIEVKDVKTDIQKDEKGDFIAITSLTEDKSGTLLEYHPGRNVPKRLTCQVTGRGTGPVIEFGVSGQLNLVAYELNGQWEGPHTTYNYGQILKKSNYKAGKLDGEMVEYYEGAPGKVKSVSNYSNNKLNGEMTLFNLDQSVNYTTQYKDGKKVE